MTSWGIAALAVAAGVVGYTAAYFLSHQEVQFPQDFVNKMVRESGVNLSEAVIIVTGSTSGIGQNLATELYALGATVIVASRNLKKCQSVIKEIQALHPASTGKLDCFTLDLGDLDTVNPFCAWFQAKYGRLTVLVNNAGVHYGDKITDTNASIIGPQGLDEVFATNYLGHYLLTRNLLPLIKKGRVVSTSSTYHFQADGSTLRIVDGRMPDAADPTIPGMSHRKAAYGVTKLAQILHMNHVQRLLTQQGNRDVQAVSVCPGWVRTNILPPGLLGMFLRKFAFDPRAGLLSSLGAIFDKDLRGGEFVGNTIPPLTTRSFFPALAKKLTAFGMRDGFVDLMALYMVVTQWSSYGLHIMDGSPESQNEQLAKDLCDWSESELRSHSIWAYLPAPRLASPRLASPRPCATCHLPRPPGEVEAPGPDPPRAPRNAAALPHTGALRARSAPPPRPPRPPARRPVAAPRRGTLFGKISAPDEFLAAASAAAAVAALAAHASEQLNAKSASNLYAVSDKDGNQGRWSAEEHRTFIEAVNQYGREWDKVQALVKTRSLAQVRSHAQKYFLKLSRNEDLERMHENEMWRMSAQPMASNLNALVVLDIMGSVLKKMKIKRDEMSGTTDASGTGLGAGVRALSVATSSSDSVETDKLADEYDSDGDRDREDADDLRGPGQPK